eukprot:88587-Pyramimonas_sp.AAC.1
MLRRKVLLLPGRGVAKREDRDLGVPPSIFATYCATCVMQRETARFADVVLHIGLRPGVKVGSK